MNDSFQQREQPNHLLTQLFKTGMIGILNYLRWTQILPMLLVWVFFILGALMFISINFQDESMAVLIWLSKLTTRIPGLNDLIASTFEESGVVTASGAIYLTDEQLLPWVSRIWLLASLAMMLGELLWHKLRGTKFEERSERSFSALMRICVLACSGIMLVCALSYFFGDAVNDETKEAGFPLLVILIPAAVLLVSVYSLSVSRLLLYFRHQLELIGERQVSVQ